LLFVTFPDTRLKSGFLRFTWGLILPVIALAGFPLLHPGQVPGYPGLTLRCRWSCG
jgi:hypothetical protein